MLRNEWALLCILWVMLLAPVALLAHQNSSTGPIGPASPAQIEPSNRLPDFSPAAIRKTRVELYFQAARQPLVKLAPRVYAFASNAERCRLNSGAKACNLPAEPLKSSDLKQIFKYYVKQPVEAILDQQQLDIRKSDWIWQPYFNHRTDEDSAGAGQAPSQK